MEEWLWRLPGIAIVISAFVIGFCFWIRDKQMIRIAEFTVTNESVRNSKVQLPNRGNAYVGKLTFDADLGTVNYGKEIMADYLIVLPGTHLNAKRIMCKNIYANPTSPKSYTNVKNHDPAYGTLKYTQNTW